ncbi:PREDICTED: pentatricopeptide repeat-containing protein At3g09040, mitochondrial [Camelina sativa]|uniref:Pentatricopeptide repeat-containing protein At3g09040, mitochondrial n=1 Tax=Camelina sativa TaxID=90675 RepID=A0ABM1RCC3_CAMSA|nr:PREDICTED: pentatricopeptide repeat-containing protein At3g09040, mitochondrial [Camelina sativa]
MYFRVLLTPSSPKFSFFSLVRRLSYSKDLGRQIYYGHVMPSHDQLHQRLVEICLDQCKLFKSRKVFDGMPQRLALALRTGKAVHSKSLILGICSEGKLGNAIVDLYAKCSEVSYAEKLFDSLGKDVTAWNSMLSMYSKLRQPRKVLRSFVLLFENLIFPNKFTFSIVLSTCARETNVEFGRLIHCCMIKMGLERNSYCGGALVDMYAKFDMYAKCGLIGDARLVFDGIVDPNTVCWTCLFSGYVKAGLPEEAVRVFERMRDEGHQPDHLAFVTVINTYISLGKLKDARVLFGEMPNPDVVAWNVMISGHGKRGCETVAIGYFLNMRKSGVKSTRSTLGSVLSAIGIVANLDLGLVVHAEAIKQGLASNIYVGSSLVSMYSKCEKMEAAAKVFEALEERNDVLWNAMIRGYAHNGEAHKVVALFMDMKSSGYNIDDFTFTSLLSTCAASHDLVMGSQFHSVIIKKKLTENLFVGNALVDMYAKCGALEDARQIFERMCDRDNVSWNTIIGSYVQDENESEAFGLFKRMNSCGIVSDGACLASTLKACTNVHGLDQGKQVHCLSVKCGLDRDLHTGSSLIDMYSKCGIIEDARKFFSSMPEWSVVSMNALIAGYSQNNLKESVVLFQEMLARGVNPSEITFATIVEACHKPEIFTLGTQFHGQIIKRGFSSEGEYLGISLLGMYMNSSRMAEACALFSELPSPKSIVLWTGMMSGHSQNGFYEEALKFYKEMRHDGALPDQATFVTVLRVCSVLSSLREGRAIHSLIFHLAHDLDELTSNTLIDMYAKCGDMKSSSQVFFEMRRRSNVVPWNSLINGCAKNGYAEDALKIFDSMRQSHIMPDEITFLGVLTACSHAGKVTEGQKIFEMMIGQYGLEARVDHVACMVDLLGRWGYLQEADDFIEAQNLKPDARLWSSLLGACRIHGDDIRGQIAAEKLIALEPQNSSAYVLLSNIYASQGRWEKANALRKAMRDIGVKKVPGCSWIDVGQKTHIFAAGDKSHPDIGKIEMFLEDLYDLVKDDVIVNPDTVERASLDCV